MNSTKKVKTVLILAYFYPPENIIGAIRLSKISKYLFKNGIKPIVITNKKHDIKNPLPLEIPEEYVHYVDWFDISIPIQKLYDSSNSILHFFGQVLFKIFPKFPGRWPEMRSRFWRKPAFNKAMEIITKEKIDIILSTTSPPATLFIASKLKKTTNIPWVADYRDPWSFNPYNNKGFLINFIENYIEKRVLKNVDKIITVSSVLKDQFIAFAKKDTFVIYNGFDNIITSKDKELTLNNNKLSIIHTGSVYKGKRDPSPLFEAINNLRKRGVNINELTIQFYGNSSKSLSKVVNKFKLEKIVELKETVSVTEIQKIQKAAGILLLLTWNNEIAKGTLTGKLFEYLGVCRPILAIGYPGEIKKILDDTKSGVLINKPSEIEIFIEKALEVYKTDRNLGFEFDNKNIEIYSRENQTLKLIDVLNSSNSSGRSNFLQ